MSSPKASAKTAQRPKSARPIAKPAAGTTAKATAENDTSAAADAGKSAEASRLASDLEQALAAGRSGLLSPQALQALMGALCKTYAAEVEAGQQILPLGDRSAVSPTEVMVTASGLLKAANLAVFELGMWQSWTGR